ncbi:uncharacterized protein LOC125709400 [Brienomyrus brachyistius]|uniref:uncharacterized protein LOC125709400 n=1 Tax=Brienomyrus brachyistius TaxID=42636 RepID=UPI0020B39E83|nr:uncharacterized protein LOC125709400 [Brienomyrus brachyistius]XP_048833728.1 uncharacterized protein LOC125709400 [Brienomyrus brachyistius]
MIWLDGAMKETRRRPLKTMILGATLHVFCVICAIHGANQMQGTYTGKKGEAHLPDHLDPATIKPPIISVVSQPHTLIVQVLSDEELWKEIGDHLEYRVLYKKEEEESFRIYKNFSYRFTHLPIEGLDAGVKYCVKVIYIAYNKPLNEPSNLECAFVTELEDTKRMRDAVGIAVAVILLCVLVPSCLWMVGRNQKRLKQALKPPLSVPLHFQEFLMEDFDPSQPSVDAKHCGSSTEEVWDTISVVSTGNSAAHKIHFVVGGSMPEAPGNQEQPLLAPGQDGEDEISLNNGSL